MRLCAYGDVVIFDLIVSHNTEPPHELLVYSETGFSAMGSWSTIYVGGVP